MVGVGYGGRGMEGTKHRVPHSPERLQSSLTVFHPCRAGLSMCLSEFGKEMNPQYVLFLRISHTLNRV